MADRSHGTGSDIPWFVVPEKDAANFYEPFKRIGESIRLTDAH